MSSLSSKRLMTYFILGAAVGILFLFLDSSEIFLYRIIDGLLAASIFPLIIGGSRLAKYVGSFDLLFFAFKNIRGKGKQSEKQDTYSDYLSQEKPDSSYKEPLLVGSIYLIVSIFMIIAFY